MKLGLTVEATKQRFVNLLKINEALTEETDFEALLSLIVSKSSELLGAERATLYLLDEARNELWSKIAQGMQEIRLAVGHGIAGYVAETGQIVNLEDAYLDSRFDPSRDSSNGFRTRSVLAVPLHDSKGTLIGVLQVINKRVEDGPFDADDQELLVALSSTATIAIQNARLIDQVQEQERLKAELEIAVQIQRDLLPATMPEIPGLEIYAVCRPSKEMSGDYFNILASDGRVGMIVADVCGKSVPAAFLMALSHNTVRIAMDQTSQPRDMLKQANRWLYNQVGDRYVAVTSLVYDLKKKRLLFSNAGQPTYPIIIRDGQCITLELGGLPLGILDDVEYRQIGRTLRSGDLVIICTDGVVEATNSEREIYTFERLHEIAKTCGELSPKQTIERIIAAVDAFAYPCEQYDDITIMAFRLV